MQRPAILDRSIIIPPQRLEQQQNDQESPQHTHTIIFFHGLGQTPQTFVPIFEAMNLTHTKVILPSAPQQYVTAFDKQTTSWYDVTAFGGKRTWGYGEDFSGMNRTMDELTALLDYEIEQLPSKSPQNILISGFSQGATITQTFAPRYKHTLAAVVAYSGYTLLSNQHDDDEHYKYPIINTNTPLVIIQGLKDDIVTPLFSIESRKYWRERGLTVIEHDFEEIAHVVSDDGLAILKDLMNNCAFY